MASLTKLFLGWSAYFKQAWPHGAAHGVAPPAQLLEALRSDGIQLLSYRRDSRQMQCIVEADDQSSPQHMAQRLKGRWNHLLRTVTPDFPGYERSFFMRTLGQNTKDVVEHYIQSQVDASDLACPIYRQRMQELRFQNPTGQAVKNSHKAIYDLFCHVIFVTADRYRMSSADAKRVLEALKAGMAEVGVEPYDGSMMPDHAHFLVRWPSQLGAEELIEKIKCASGRNLRRSALWSGGGYVGTVGPYSLQVAIGRNRECGWCGEPHRQ